MTTLRLSAGVGVREGHYRPTFLLALALKFDGRFAERLASGQPNIYVRWFPLLQFGHEQILQPDLFLNVLELELKV